jgi:hypothetical protein
MYMGAFRGASDFRAVFDALARLALYEDELASFRAFLGTADVGPFHVDDKKRLRHAEKLVIILLLTV